MQSSKTLTSNPRALSASYLQFSRLLCLILISLLIASLSACTRSSETGLNPGDLAPDFRVKALNTEAQKLSDFRGKVILVNFWASWCAPCVEEMPALQRLYRRLKDQDFEVVAVGVDDEEYKLREFVERYGLSFPVVFDLDDKAGFLYNLSGVPESFLIDRDGKLLMIMDPADNVPTVRMTGPRPWDSPNTISRISALLKK